MRFNPYDIAGAIDFGDRSRPSERSMIGVPPAYVKTPIVRNEGGVAYLQGVPLPKLQPENAPPGQAKMPPQSAYIPALYGDAIIFPVVFAAAGERMVLERPNNTRIELLIVNLSVLGNIFYAFDRVADAISSVPIVAGGNRLFDSVCPQGELHINASAAGTVIIEYMNREISKESYR